MTITEYLIAGVIICATLLGAVVWIARLVDARQTAERRRMAATCPDSVRDAMCLAAMERNETLIGNMEPDESARLHWVVRDQAGNVVDLNPVNHGCPFDESLPTPGKPGCREHV